MVLHLPTRKSSREVILMMTEKFTRGLLNRYIQRPASLENISLADNSCRKPFMKKSKSIDINNLPLETSDDDENNDDELFDSAKNITPIGEHGKPKQLLKPRISAWFNVKSHPEKHYRELIMLLTAWQNKETDLICSSSSYQERYIRK